MPKTQANQSRVHVVPYDAVVVVADEDHEIAHQGLGSIKRATKQHTVETLLPGFPHGGFTGIRHLQDIYDSYVTTTSFWKGLEILTTFKSRIDIRNNSAQKETKVHPSMPCPNPKRRRSQP